MLVLENISKKYNNYEVLKNINIKFNNKGLVTILGKSGSGKSTLLNIMALFESPDTGNILYNDKNILEYNKKNKEKFISENIAVIFQQYNLINELTVKENILLATNNYSLDILQKLHIDTLENKKVKNLSGGEIQRVAIARAIMANKKIILCDEPTGALDDKTGISIMSILKSFAKDRLVIVVTHNEEYAQAFSDRIIRIKDGNILSDEIIKPIKNKKEDILNYIKQDNLKSIINIIKSNLQIKKKRVILTIIAFSIGLLSLLSVLSISRGFKISLDDEDKNSLSTYPLYISKYSLNTTNELSDLFNNKNSKRDLNYIYSKEIKHINKMNKKLINYLNKLVPYTNYFVCTYQYKNILLNSYDLKNKNIYKELKLISGRKPQKDNEIFLLIDNNNYIDANILNTFGFYKNKYKLETLINKKIKINSKKYIIRGIYQAKDNNSKFYDSYGLFISNNNFNKIPYEVYLYPKDYKNKKIIVDKLNKYSNLEYTDYSSTIKYASNSLMDALSIILIIFSILSLVVSAIMISIITYISIYEQMHNIGILKSIGYNSFSIKLIFYLENIFISFLSSIFSIIIMFLVSIPCNSILLKLTGLKNIILLDIKNIFFIVFLSIFISFVSTIIPVRKTDKLYIVDILKYN